MFFELVPQYTALPRRRSSYHPYLRQHSYAPVAMRLPVGDSWLDFDDELTPFSNFLHWPMATRRCPTRGRKLQQHEEKTSLEEDDRPKDSVRQERQDSQKHREVVTSHTEEQEKEEQVVKFDGEKRLVEIDAAGVEPSDIQVKTNSAKGVITVTMKRHHMTLFGPIASMSTRVLPFPESVKADDIRSYVTPEDKLVITLKKKDEEEAKAEVKMDEEPEASRDEVTTHEDELLKTEGTEMTDTDSFEVVDSESRNAEAASDKMEEDDGAFARVEMRGFDAADISVRVSEDGHNVEVVGEREEKTEHGCTLHRVFRSLPLPQQQQQQDGDIEHRVDSQGVVHLIAREKQESIEQ